MPQGRISGACFDAALGNIDKLTIMGTQFPTPDGAFSLAQKG
jgi:UDP-arabinose 4-epimerase